MPNSASKCFLSGPNQLNSSKDYIDRKKAQTIYQTTKNSKTLKQNGTQYNGPIFVNTSGCLGAIGGYNSNNYELFAHQITVTNTYCQSQNSNFYKYFSLSDYAMFGIRNLGYNVVHTD